MPERKGLLGEAEGTTLFLDEFGELPEALQTRLLRVLDDGEYQRLGEDGNCHADVRFVAATNRADTDLKYDVAARLKLRLMLEGLNAKREDIPLICRHLLRQMATSEPTIVTRFFSGEDRDGFPRLDPELVRTLVAHQYRTHVRELEILLWRVVAASAGPWLVLPESMEFGPPAGEPSPVGRPGELTRTDLEEAMTRHGGVLEAVWRELGLKNRFVLYRLLKKHGVSAKGEDESTGREH